ncbi:MAG: RNA polymerase sigma factor [Melioribacteraceae bacterium]|jgi:RNA polymerase sigma-70 factor (ECF subfamily)|nr:RNA polymerase sigma factor [Melioribacteraceae bacterium]
MANEEDFELINKFIGGDETAYNKLVKKYQKRIYWQARQMLGNHHDADEITQEVFLVIYRKINGFNFLSSFYTWVYKIVNTRCLNEIKRRNIRKFFSIDDDATLELKNERDFIYDIETKEKVKTITNALQKIPVKQREVFVLRNFNELSYEEISKMTGKSVGGLKANYFHALRKVLELTNEK